MKTALALLLGVLLLGCAQMPDDTSETGEMMTPDMEMTDEVPAVEVEMDMEEDVMEEGDMKKEEGEMMEEKAEETPAE